MSGINKIQFQTVSSTNTYAKENIKNLSLPALIISDEQTAGRGRQGKSFFSPKDTGLYMTLVFNAPESCELLTPVAAVAVCKELETLGIKPKIKWVNDIFVNERKVCGILTECFSKGDNIYIALGIGINLTTESFPNELNIAGSLSLSCDKTKLAENISRRILSFCQNNNKDIIKEYKKRLFVLNKDIKYTKNNREFSARAVDINELCNLIVKHSDGSEAILSSGEISINL